MKILIIKLGALGDVVRTLPIAEALRNKYGNSEITWITKANAVELFEKNPYINKVFPIPFNINEKFDILYNFDIDKEATELAYRIQAEKKFGFYLDGKYPSAFNAGAEYYLNTLFDDELKKSNRKTYQEMMFEAAELPYKREMPKIYLNKEEREYANLFIEKNKINKDRLIGIHMGAGHRWPSKAWGEDKIKDFAKKAKEQGYEIIILGGPNEMEKIDKLAGELNDEKIKVYKNNPGNSIKEFSALIDCCKVIVCSDSLALHIALAMKKPTIGLFFCTAPHEVEDYGLLTKIVSTLLYEYFPERQNEHSLKLRNSINSEDVLRAIQNIANLK